MRSREERIQNSEEEEKKSGTQMAQMTQICADQKRMRGQKSGFRRIGDGRSFFLR
jgi:hypothetical protein